MASFSIFLGSLGICLILITLTCKPSKDSPSLVTLLFDYLNKKIDAVEESLSKKVGAVADSLAAHRADTESHAGYKVSE